MQIKLFKDLKKYTLTSTLTKADIETLKKYRPEALKIPDEEGNDLFAMSYVEGHPCVSAHGVTFGAATSDGGYAMIAGDLPANLPAGQTYGEYVADVIGAALVYINQLEEAIPYAVEDVKHQRDALLSAIVEA